MVQAVPPNSQSQLSIANKILCELIYFYHIPQLLNTLGLLDNHIQALFVLDDFYCMPAYSLLLSLKVYHFLRFIIQSYLVVKITLNIFQRSGFYPGTNYASVSQRQATVSYLHSAEIHLFNSRRVMDGSTQFTLAIGRQISVHHQFKQELSPYDYFFTSKVQQIARLIHTYILGANRDMLSYN